MGTSSGTLTATGDFLRPTNNALQDTNTPGAVNILGYSLNTSFPAELSVFSTN